MSPGMKRDMQLLKMRGVLDPKRHYKKYSGKRLGPDFSQAGHVIQGSAEFFSARISKKERKNSITGEILADEGNHGRFERNYRNIQSSKTDGRKEFYKKLKAQRSKAIRKS